MNLGGFVCCSWNDVPALGRGADHSPPSSAEVKECVELYPSTPQYAFIAWCLVKHRDNNWDHETQHIYLFIYRHSRIRGSSVSTVTRLWDGRPGFPGRSRDSFLFATASRPALGSTHPPVQWVPEVLSARVKRLGLEADYSPQRNAGLKFREAAPPLHRTPPCIDGVVVEQLYFYLYPVSNFNWSELIQEANFWRRISESRGISYVAETISPGSGVGIAYEIGVKTGLCCLFMSIKFACKLKKILLVLHVLKMHLNILYYYWQRYY
jgi:hypothetical protein